MTMHELGSTRPPGPPQRSGEPWTDDDYETLVRLCRTGADLATISQRLQRKPAPVRERAKRLLPLDQRGVPGDRVLTQLRKNLDEDPDYDWGHHLATTPPPRPIVNHVLPAPRYAGLAGLRHNELLVMAEAMARLGHPGTPDDHVARALAHEVAQRGLSDDLRSAAAASTRQRVEQFLERARFGYHPAQYWEMDDTPEWIDNDVPPPPVPRHDDPPPAEDPPQAGTYHV